MLERSVACSDSSLLYSYFSTGIVRLMSPLHNRCHLSVRLRAVQNLRGFSGYDCKTEQGTDGGNAFFRQVFDTLSKARQGRVGRTNGDNCLSFIEEKNQSGTRKWLISSWLLHHFGSTCEPVGSFSPRLAGWLRKASEYRTINTVTIGSKIIVSFIIGGFSPFAKKLSE